MKLQNIKVSETKKSETNAPGRTSGKSFDELVASVKEKGVLVPVLARAITGEDRIGKYEVIAGNRRLAAAKEAGLEEIPAKIVEMTDDEAREAQIVENLQREDIHPLDEGILYRNLIEEAKLEIKVVAARVGKSERYVRERLYLTNLGPKAAKFYQDGKMNDGHAVLVAKLSNTDQESAVKFIKEEYMPPTVKELKEWINENVYSNLENQPWIGNAEAGKAVGACKECNPSAMSLFGAVREGACTSLKCWARKMEKYLAWRIKEGHLSQVSGDYGQSEKGVLPKSEYVEVPKRGKNRCDSAMQAIIVDSAEIGKEIDVCVDPKCEKHGTQHSSYQLTPEEKQARREERKKERELKKKETERREKKLAKALDNVKFPLVARQLDALVELAVQSAGQGVIRSVVKRHELEVEKKSIEYYALDQYDYEGALRKMIGEIGANAKMRLVFEILADTGYEEIRDGIDKI